MHSCHLSVIIPAYNEAKRIGASLAKIEEYLSSRRFSAELIVVDDGSTDDTMELLAREADHYGCLQVLRNERNRGKGFSVRRGVLAAQGALVLFTDADLSAPIGEADKLIEVLEQEKADAVVGSRAINRKLIGIRQPWFRDLGGRFFNLLVRLFTGLGIKDTQCGLKLFRLESTRPAFELQRTEGFGFDPELLFLIHRSGGKIMEVPVRWNNDPASKVHFLRDSARMVLALVVLRWRFWRGGYQLNRSAQQV
jgi:glycosyltransferase involved in cell wall biosynthesis